MVRQRSSSDVFRALADPTRRKLMDRLLVEDTAVLNLAVDFEMSLAAISQHLKILREAGLVSERREGRQRIYYLQATPLREVADWLSHYERFWKSKLKRLGDHLRENP